MNLLREKLRRKQNAAIFDRFLFKKYNDRALVNRIFY